MNFYEKHPEIPFITVPLIFFDAQEGNHPLNYKFDKDKVVDLQKDWDNIQLHANSSFFKRKWKVSANGNDYLKLDDHLVVICRALSREMWKFAIDNVFSEKAYDSKERAKAAAFDQLERIRESGIDLMLRKN